MLSRIPFTPKEKKKSNPSQEVPDDDEFDDTPDSDSDVPNFTDNDARVEYNSEESEKLTTELLAQYRSLLKDKKYCSNPKNGSAITRMQNFIKQATRQYRATAAKAPVAKKPIMIVAELDDILDPRSYDSIATAPSKTP